MRRVHVRTRRLLATLTDPAAVRKSLTHLGVRAVLRGHAPGTRRVRPTSAARPLVLRQAAASRGSQREIDREDASLVRKIVHPDLSSVGFDRATTDG